MKTKAIIPVILMALCFVPAANSAPSIPSNELVNESALACVGLAQKYGGESRRFNYETVKAFISSEVDDCVQLLSWSRFNAQTGKSIHEKIESDWKRTAFDAPEDELKFYDYFHQNIMSGAVKSITDDKFRNEMVGLGSLAAANKNHRNI